MLSHSDFAGLITLSTRTVPNLSFTSSRVFGPALYGAEWTGWTLSFRTSMQCLVTFGWPKWLFDVTWNSDETSKLSLREWKYFSASSMSSRQSCKFWKDETFCMSFCDFISPSRDFISFSCTTDLTRSTPSYWIGSSSQCEWFRLTSE